MATEYVESKDGTKIAYEKSGSGPAIILVTGAMMTRTMHDEMAKLLAASNFTVYNYDRRARGESDDTKPFAVKREIEDIEALIDKAGGTASIYGISSGACLALQAAAVLNNKIYKLALYEAPYDDAAGVAEMWKTYRTNLETSVVAGRNDEAVELFMKQVGTPDEMVVGMKTSQMWPALKAVAPSLPYDAAAMGDDRSVPVDTASNITAETLIMDGALSRQYMPFMAVSADKLATAIPKAKRQTIEGQSHDVNTAVLAPVLSDFFKG